MFKELTLGNLLRIILCWFSGHKWPRGHVKKRGWFSERCFGRVLQKHWRPSGCSVMVSK